MKTAQSKALEKAKGGKKLKVHEVGRHGGYEGETAYYSGGRGTKTEKRHMFGPLGYRVRPKND